MARCSTFLGSHTGVNPDVSGHEGDEVVLRDSKSRSTTIYKAYQSANAATTACPMASQPTSCIPSW